MLEVQFVSKIPNGFSHIKGMREPLYGDDNEIIGYREAGNSQVKPLIVVVKGEEKQLKKYHLQTYEQVQDWLVIELATRIRNIARRRDVIRGELTKLDLDIFEANALAEQLKATAGTG